MRKILYIILIFSYTNFCLADSCRELVTYLTKNSSAPCTGYLFSPQKESQVRLIKEQLDDLQAEFNIQTNVINSLTQNINLYKDSDQQLQQQEQLWQKADQECTDKLIKEDSSRGLRDLLVFGAGVVTVLLSGIALRQIK